MECSSDNEIANPLVYNHSMFGYFYPSTCIKPSLSPYQEYPEAYRHQEVANFTVNDSVSFQQNPQDYYYYLQKSYEYFEANREESQARCGFWNSSVCSSSSLGSPGNSFPHQWGCREVGSNQECEVATHGDVILEDNLDINSPCSDDSSGNLFTTKGIFFLFYTLLQKLYRLYNTDRVN